MSTQEEAIKLIESGVNVFLSGPGGCGKSWVIKKVTNKGTLLTAPTGAASINIGGITTHKAFALPIGIPTTEDYLKIPSKVKKILSSKHLKRIVIDEISLTSAMTLDMINHRLQQARGNKLLFGGVQMLVVGDFHQISPVINYKDSQLYYKQYDSPFAFSAKCWDFKTVQLDKNYRQGNETHVRVLSSFRKKDKWTERAIEWLGETCEPYDENKDVLTLCVYKADAERINNIHYARLANKEKQYKGITNNKKWPCEIMVPEVVKLKEGAKVSIRANCPEGNYVNGSRGEVLRMLPKSVIVKLDNGEEVEVVNFTWESYKYDSTAKGLSKTVEFVYEQIPLQLGWACTVHSAQGLTLDQYAMDLGKGAFGPGITYVGLSRARDLSKISFATPITMRDIIVDERVLNFYNNSFDTHQPSV